MDAEHFEALKKAKTDNYDLIYRNDIVKAEMQSVVKPMMSDIYEKLLKDLKSENKSSPIFTHHINYINKAYYKREMPYEQTEPNQIVVDYIASMTDDYFIDLYAHLFPEGKLKITYKGYFD
jgi:dGTPase